MLAATSAGIEHPDDAELSAAASLAKLPQESEQVDQLKGQIDQSRAEKQQSAISSLPPMEPRSVMRWTTS